MHLIDTYNTFICIFLMMVGFFGVIAPTNLVKKLIGLSIFQVSVLLYYISIAKIKDAAAPILKIENHQLVESINGQEIIYNNPLPHVLMLTAIVVGVAVLAVGLALIVRIKESYGTIEEDEIIEIDSKK